MGMALHGGDLLVVGGDHFFRLDPATLAIKLHTSLLPESQQQNIRTDAFLNSPAPQMACSGDILYRLLLAQRAPVTVTAIDTTTGKVLAEKALPAELSNTDWKYVKDGPTFDYSNYNMMPPLPPAQIKATADAVYVLCYGGLVKLDAKTLEPVKVKALYGPVINVAENATTEAKTFAGIDHARRTLPAVMLLQDNAMLIVIGDDFFRVNTDTLEIEKQTQLAQVDDNALVKRMNQLLSYKQPQVLPTAHGLLVTRGKECMLVNTQNGSVRPLQLPEALTHPLPYLRPHRPLPKTIVPEDGKTITLQGVAWSKMEGDNSTWYFCDQSIGTVKLTGAKIGAISEDPNQQQGVITVQGVFHKAAGGGEEKVVGTVDTIDNPNAFQIWGHYNCNGIIHKHQVGDAVIWTISSTWFACCEFVLGGDKLKELTAIPDIEGREVFVMGKYAHEHEKVPPYGQGYLDIDSYILHPTPESLAEKQEQATPSIPAASETSLYVIRNGAIARFDAATLAPQAVRDLLPPAPDILKSGEITDEVIKAVNDNWNLRMALPLAFPQGNDLGVVSGNGYALLDGVTLDVKAQQQPGKSPLVPPLPFGNGALNYLVDGPGLLAINGINLLRLDLATGNTTTTVALPAQMVNKVFPIPE